MSAPFTEPANKNVFLIRNEIFSNDLFSLLKGIELREWRNKMRFLEASLHTPWCVTKENPV